jgi:hypothetical protein
MKEDIKTNQAKTDVNLRAVTDEMRAGQELLKVVMLAKLDAHHKDDAWDGLPARENGRLYREDRDHGFGCKSRRNRV